MTHPIVALQAALVQALREGAGLAVLDAVPPARQPPYGVIVRHDVAPRDGDAAPGHVHRLTLQIWQGRTSRAAVLALAEAALAVMLSGTLAPSGLAVTLRRHEGTESAIETESGRARAALRMIFYTEPI